VIRGIHLFETENNFLRFLDPFESKRSMIAQDPLTTMVESRLRNTVIKKEAEKV
jgi:hypothetical protein